MSEADCTHSWKKDKRGMRCENCQWLIDDGGPLPTKGLGLGLFNVKDEPQKGRVVLLRPSRVNSRP